MLEDLRIIHQNQEILQFSFLVTLTEEEEEDEENSLLIAPYVHVNPYILNLVAERLSARHLHALGQCMFVYMYIFPSCFCTHARIEGPGVAWQTRAAGRMLTPSLPCERLSYASARLEGGGHQHAEGHKTTATSKEKEVKLKHRVLVSTPDQTTGPFRINTARGISAHFAYTSYMKKCSHLLIIDRLQ